MRVFRFNKLKEVPQIVDELLASVGKAHPSINISITAALTKDLSRKGSTDFSPEIGAELPVEGVDVQAKLKAELIREFAKHGTGLILVDIQRPARTGEQDGNQ